jgi:hypothetical protein
MVLALGYIFSCFIFIYKSIWFYITIAQECPAFLYCTILRKSMPVPVGSALQRVTVSALSEPVTLFYGGRFTCLLCCS